MPLILPYVPKERRINVCRDSTYYLFLTEQETRHIKYAKFFQFTWIDKKYQLSNVKIKYQEGGFDALKGHLVGRKKIII
jgi:hypothetical protein